MKDQPSSDSATLGSDSRVERLLRGLAAPQSQGSRAPSPAAIGPYRLLEPLGRGGMGIVYRAEHAQTGQTVALKTVRLPHAGLLQSIRREVHALAQLRHPGIVRIFEGGLHEGMPWYAMELLSGVSLRQWMPSDLRRQPSPGVTRAPDPEQRWWTETLAEARPAQLPPAEPSERASAGIDATEPLSLSLRSALVLLRRLCFTLSYLHGEGIVHRDLKPENILVQQLRVASSELRVENGDPVAKREAEFGPELTTHNSQLTTCCPVIVDFGVVSRSGAELSRDALEVEGLGSGTVTYMAPEQARGHSVDARADLYALGCILYELLTGRPPFLGKTSGRVLQQHLEAPPVSPSKLAPGIPPELEELTLRLLQKEPRLRLGYADDVAAALGRLGIDAEPPAGAPAGRTYLYRPGLAGRQDFLEQLQGHLEALRAGTGGMLFAGGESGVGKTRLLVELGRRARQMDVQVLAGECLPPAADRSSGGGAPLQAFRKPLQAVADRCRERGALETDRLLGGRALVLAAYEPSIAGIPGLEGYPKPAELPPDEARVRLLHYVAETILAMGGAGSGNATPVLLLLDDLQWADELSLGALDVLLRSLAASRRERTPLLVIGAYRSEEAGPGLGKLLDAITAGEPGSLLRVERLGNEAVARIAADMLGLSQPPAEAFVRFLREQSEGNPFFVAEYLRAMLDAGAEGRSPLLVRDIAGRWQVADPAVDTRDLSSLVSLPRSLRELVSGRLGRLSDDARRLVESLAVLGREAAGPLVASISDLHDSAVMTATLEAIARQVLEPIDVEGLRFVHDKLREVAYVDLEADRRRQLHRAAATALEALVSEPASLAMHWEQGGEPQKARPHHLAAARQQRDRYAWEEAESHYRAYLRLTPQPSIESARALLELGEDVLQARGELRQAIDEQNAALEQTRQLMEPRLEGELMGCLGNLYRLTGEVETGRAILEQALGIHRETGNRRGEGIALYNLANLHQEQGRNEEARALNEQALEIQRQLGDRRAEGQVLGSLAIVHKQQGRVEEARALYEQALELLRPLGDRREEGQMLEKLAVLHFEQGRVEDARVAHEQALELLRQVGDRRREALVLGNLAVLQHEGGCFKEALALYERAVDLLHEAEDRRSEGVMLCNLANLHYQLGGIEDASVLYEKAVSVLRQVGDRRCEGFALCNLANLHREADRIEEAQTLVERALVLHRQVGDRRFESIALYELANLQGDQGHVEEARVLFQQALDLQRQVGERRFEGVTLGELAKLHHEQGRVEEAELRFGEAVAILHEIGDRVEEGIALCGWAALQRRAFGQLERSLQTSLNAEALFGRAESKPLLAWCHCEQGHLALARGQSARARLEQVEALAAGLPMPPRSRLGKALAGLRRAQQAFEAGKQHRLFRGELAADLPEALRRWLAESGLLAG